MHCLRHKKLVFRRISLSIQGHDSIQLFSHSLYNAKCIIYKISFFREQSSKKRNKKGEGIWGDGHFLHGSLYSAICQRSMLPHCSARSLLHRHRSLIAAESRSALFWTRPQKSSAHTKKKFIEVSRLCCVYGSVQKKKGKHIFFGAEFSLSFMLHWQPLQILFFCEFRWRVIAIDSFTFMT